MFANTACNVLSFQSCPVLKRERAREAPEGCRRHLRQGEHLFYEGDTAKHVFEVISGTLRLARVQRDGRRQVMTFGLPGDLVGLPVDGRHSAECDAVEPCEVIAHRFDPLSPPERWPDLNARVLNAALEEIHALQDHFLTLGRRSACEKVAAFLLWLGSRVGARAGRHRRVHLAMNRADIADHLGLTPETVSRTITQLRESGLLALDGAQTVVILDPDGMRVLAEGG
ncbi:helix-turn-helix domain-containing protein [Albidovulum sediminicola]|uniref:Helix-turn-helix domain-containing protein n=1 Tax=Albidovulum sediminicola TaxID=2984331 RepID=A0ABT2Z2Q1_9RHOB|nr:helix-turn-helix domain-containing protein [Defluviimonas sp. WL0075]MCV2865066.1 helix-turn-helix domain-containing protein [Defluviimonas sp. WL0075]